MEERDRVKRKTEGVDKGKRVRGKRRKKFCRRKTDRKRNSTRR
jgi:hypothetical protein